MNRTSDVSYHVIKITCIGDEDATVAHVDFVLNNDEYFTAGSSRRSPEDKDDAEIGYKLAMGRAFRLLGRELLKDGNKAVKKAAKQRAAQQAASDAAKAKRDAARAEHSQKPIPPKPSKKKAAKTAKDKTKLSSNAD